jgi:hypothetical protein
MMRWVCLSMAFSHVLPLFISGQGAAVSEPP